MVGALKEGERGTCSRIIKVNHAGEFGAVNIYRAQLTVSRIIMPSLVPQLEEFIAHERQHLEFAEVLRVRRIPRCKTYWFCGLGGFSLGLFTSLFGRSVIIMPCTAAVETVVTGHLAEQLTFLESRRAWEGAAAVRAILCDEEGHKAVGIAQGRDSLIFEPIGAVVAVAISSVIWLGMRL